MSDFESVSKLIKRADLIEICKALDSGVSPELKDEYGYNLLMLSAWNGIVPVGELLIAKGADVNSPGPGGNTAAVFAASGGHTRFLKMLLRHGANPAPVSDRLRWYNLDEAKKSEITKILEDSLVGRAG